MVDLTVLVADEGRCVEEDLVKSFFPSLFDSDSESDDVYCLRSLRSDDNDTPSSVLVRLIADVQFLLMVSYSGC